MPPEPSGQQHDTEALEVVRDDKAGRYELHRDSEPIGFADFTEDGDVVIVPYVEIRADLRGQGYGDILAGGLLADLAGEDRRVVPRCGFLAGFVHDHPEYHGLVASG